MKSIKFYDKLFKQLEFDLGHIDRKSLDPKTKLLEVLMAVKKSLGELQRHVVSHTFENQEDEIYFFKFIKPKFYSSWIFAFEVHQLQLRKPIGTKEMVTAYLEDELKLLQRYFSKNEFYYHYYKSGDTGLDTLCFVRNSGITMITVPEISELEQSFSTACDLLFSKFMAYEKLQVYILELLLSKSDVDPVQATKKKPSQPTQLNLSVDQLGLIARAADDARLLIGRSFTKICEDLAPHLSTPETTNISSKSMRSNAYTGENIDKNVSIRYLEKMIGFIKEY
jgi:hypothetical protein